MGLDCYLERSDTSPESLSFPEDLHLCGGMLSGHGSDGSFRGKVYTEFFSENIGVSLYSDTEPEEVVRVAEKLSEIALTHLGMAWTEKGWQADAPSHELGYYGVTAQEVADLAALFQAAASQHLKLIASY